MTVHKDTSRLSMYEQIEALHARAVGLSKFNLRVIGLTLKDELVFYRRGAGHDDWHGRGVLAGAAIGRSQSNQNGWVVYSASVGPMGQYMVWLLERCPDLPGPHRTLSAAKRSLLDALRADMAGEIDD